MNNRLRDVKVAKGSEIFRSFGFSMARKIAGPALIALSLAATAGSSVAAGSFGNAAPTQVLTAKTFTMLAGDHGTAAMGPVRQLQTAPLRIPIGDEALKALKDKAASAVAAAADGVVTLSENPASKVPSQSLVATCTTNSAVGFAPSDINGASSSTRLVVVTNIEVGVYNQAGCGLVSKVPLKTFFGAFAPPAAETQFDPRVLYDRVTNRFFVTAESENSQNTDQYQYFAVSKDSTATSWWLYRVVLSQVSTSTVFCKPAANAFWDYPQAGVSNTRWFHTANVFGASTRGAILDIGKAPTLTGAGTVARCFANLPFNTAAPQVLDLSTNAVFLSPGSGSGSSVARLDLFQSASGVGSDTLTARPAFPVIAWTVPPDVPQPNGTTLDSIDGRFENASIQSRGQLWNIHNVNISGAAKLRWYTFNAASLSSSTTTRQVTFQTSSLDRLFNPSITTASGIAGAPAYISASRTIPSISTGAGNAAALVFYGLNDDASASDWTYTVSGTSAFQFSGCSPCRWGDYSSVTIDPSNNGSAWGFNQLVTGTSMFSWTTRAGKVNLTLPAAPTTN